MEAQREDILNRHAVEKEDMLNRHASEKSDLEEELAATCRDRDDSMMFAENEKQQVCNTLGTFILASKNFHTFWFIR